MSELQPANTTLGDVCKAALKECGAVGVGQTPLAEDINDAWSRLQWLLMQWEKKRWLVYHLVNLSCISRGAQYYTVGPYGDFDTGPTSSRPSKLSSAFVRQIGTNSGVTPPNSIWDTGDSVWDGGATLWDSGRTALQELGASQWDDGQSVWDDGASLWDGTGPAGTGPSTIMVGTNQIDYHLEILQSREDYDWITLKGLIAGPGEVAFLDSDWPASRLYIWPIPQANTYEIHISFPAQLPYQFATPATPFVIPFEYYNAMVLNLAIRLRPKYRMGTYPGDHLPGIARDSLSVVRVPNTQIARLRMIGTIRRRGQYNIFSDRP